MAGYAAVGSAQRPGARSNCRVLRAREGRLASMKPAVWMAAASLSSWLVMTLSSQGRVDPELMLGMAGPTTSAVGSWVAYHRAHRAAPGRLTNVMIAALAVKML